MYLVLNNRSFQYETENLLRVFFANENIILSDSPIPGENGVIAFADDKTISVRLILNSKEYASEDVLDFSLMNDDDSETGYTERKLELMLFELLKKATGYIPSWGILTGVRPAKLMTRLVEKYGKKQAYSYFVDELQVSPKKAALALSVAETEKPIIDLSDEKSFSLYISIPFCPTRCSYCSFVSHSNEKAKKLMPDYVRLLCREIEYTGELVKQLGLRLESIYMGGGTPTALDAGSLKTVTDAIKDGFDLSFCREYTIESGRPDSITEEKLEVIKNCGAGRISINPQTFNDDVLREIGRRHSSQMTVDSMLLARKCGFDNITMDIIAGLPTDTLESFENTVDKVLSFSPENITVHTLALKRSSSLVTEDKARGDGETADKMLTIASERLTGNGYIPYYMYRQSKCLGNLENVGWAKIGKECLYNVFMMEECHTVIAVGAGAVTKLKNPYCNEIERIFNYKYPYEYISNFSEIKKRKDKIIPFYRNLNL
ncbi:MAG: coproporphyrinogen dehydrogenase HemZ [Acutalibacteraceae bacterium]